MARVPTAEVGGVRRPVLMSAPTKVVLRELVPLGAVGPTTREIAVPEQFRNAPLRLVTTQAAVVAPILESHPEWLQHLAAFPIESIEDNIPGRTSATRLQAVVRTVERASVREPVAIDLQAAPGADAGLLEVTATRIPDAEWVTPPIAVPRGARLRFAMGLDRPRKARVPPVTFTVSAVDDSDGETVLAVRELDPDGRVQDRRWVEADVGLERFANRRIRVRFASTHGVGLPWWADPTIVAPRDGASPGRKNLLLVSLDTLRADRLGAYGYRRPTSPILDAFAAAGTVFERAYAPFPRTDGSHGTMLTGLAPCVHGSTKMNAGPLRADALTLAEHLRAAGWETGAVTEDGLVTARNGFARGFGTWKEHKSLRRGIDVAVTFADGIAWIRRHRAGPWFLFLHTYQTHAPYQPPPGYVDRVAGEGARDPVASVLYDAEIRYVDDRFGELLHALAELGEAEETVVVVVSDHGEHFGEHGLFGHAVSLYDVLLHVPFIVRSPGQVPAAKRVDDAVGLVDLVPTALELLGLPAPRWTHGRSVVPLLRDHALPDTLLFAEGFGETVAARRGRYKWFVNRVTGDARVVDLTTDPQEAAPTPIANKNVLAAYQAQCAAPPPPPVVEDVTVPIDPAVEEKLRALGYVDY